LTVAAGVGLVWVLSVCWVIPCVWGLVGFLAWVWVAYIHCAWWRVVGDHVVGSVAVAGRGKKKIHLGAGWTSGLWLVRYPLSHCAVLVRGCGWITALAGSGGSCSGVVLVCWGDPLCSCVLGAGAWLWLAVSLGWLLLGFASWGCFGWVCHCWVIHWVDITGGVFSWLALLVL